ncbi:PQQ-dependent sugar dehydrogenase [Maribacter sp. MMG018]|uniref:PVC-type heme-binding CxxCH protein n=1 Tax=Maribacter sp. MMG018 TaxID=2822688 RepID=UPI001B375609|nr:PVC-type heme-binding CxxCH protein [Maribacter sp. MMG018]MBQ4915977.1 PQQ-dependent sugar dehydrogenase [Maribacter sp. MMG018]
MKRKIVLDRCKILLIFSILMGACKSEVKDSGIDYGNLSDKEKRMPENALLSMEVADSLHMQLFASEPMIGNPTNIAVDSKGRIWLCEGKNYRLSVNPKNAYDKKGDRILILEDSNGDGKADKSKVFYQGEDVNSALGIVVLGNRVIVSASPNILVFTDENEDDVPDKKEIMFTGIGGVDHDHGAHAVVFGADGRLYFNYGNKGQYLTSEDGNVIKDIHGEEIDASRNPYQEGMAFRCEQDGSRVEVIGDNFRNPYELAVDSYGSIWQSDNDDDGNRGVRINYLMEYGNYGYKDRITGANWRERRPGWSDSIPLRHWHLNDPGTVPNMLQTGSGSPCGMIVYEGDLLPDLYKGQLIHCEPGHNVVRSYIMKNEGAGYSASIKNIVKSKDDWFRPDDVAEAPDGSLFVSDWYDGGVGGHKAEDIFRGRIYRISTLKEYSFPKFDFTTGDGAAKGLTSGNMDVFFRSWQKLHQMGEEAEPYLNLLISKGGVAKARALWLGARIPSRSSFYIDMALADDDPKIRVQGIRMARYFSTDNITGYVEKVIKDASVQVRREAAIALRYIGSKEAALLWANLATQHKEGDRWELEALGIGGDKFADLYFSAWKNMVGNRWNSPEGAEMVWRINAKETVPLMIDLIKDKNVDPAKVPSYFRAFHFKEHPLKNQMLLSMLDVDHPQDKMIWAYAVGQLDKDFVNSSPKNIRLVKKILPSIEGTQEWIMIVKNLNVQGQERKLFDLMISDAENSLRTEAAQYLFESGGESIVENYLNSDVGDNEKNAVMDILGGVNSIKAMGFMERCLIQNKFQPILMKKVIEALGNTRRGQNRLFGLLKQDKLRGELKSAAALKLMSSSIDRIKEGALKYLDMNNNISQDIEVLMKKEGNPIKGKIVYRKYCISCHVAEEEGVDFGPALSDIGNKLSRGFLYSSIINPSEGINFGYEGYTLKLKDGGRLNGYILGRSETDITIKMMGATTKVIPEENIESIEEMKNSLMPEGLDKVMKEGELVDLIAYLETLKV